MFFKKKHANFYAIFSKISQTLYFNSYFLKKWRIKIEVYMFLKPMGEKSKTFLCPSPVSKFGSYDQSLEVCAKFFINIRFT